MKNNFTETTAVKKYFHFGIRACLPILFLLAVRSNSFAQNSVDILIDPAATEVEVNETFSVDVKVDFGTGSLASVNAYVFFNTLDLEVLSTTVPAATSGTLLPGVSIGFNTVANMNSTGEIRHGRFNSDPIASGTHPTADFVFFTISFRAKRVPPGGTTALTFGTTFPTETAAGEFGQDDALNQTVNGAVTISAVGCTTPLATISAPGNTLTCSSQPFNLMLASASNGTGPFDLTIEGPNGVPVIYNDISVGNVITTFTPTVEKIWPDIITPAPVSDYFAAYTLGMKFTSSVAGFVKGVRFFSAELVSSVPGDYTGQLWSESGDLLASGTFTGVVVDSWHELIFAEPVLIAPGTVYIASYSTGTSAGYASTTDGLSADVTNGSLTAIGNGSVFSVNSVTPVTFPNSPSNDNYWVDVVFSPNQYTFNLTGVTDNLGCSNTGALQTLAVTSVDCDALPVSLLNLSATPRDNSILLAWSTASEINNKGFEIQRKTGTGDWSVIGFVNGAGTSNSTRNYNHIDEKLSAARYYYRLRQVDIDGRFEYSSVVSAIIGGAEKFSLEQNYPNPFRNETVVRFTLPQKANVKLTLFDMHGRIVKTLVNGSKEKGTHAVTVNASALSSGLYYYRLESDNFSAVKKMTIQ